MTAEPQPLEHKPEEQPPLYAPSVEGKLRQGEFLSGLSISKLPIDAVTRTIDGLQAGESLSFVVRSHPYVLVVSQDCDLEQDFTLRQTQPAVAPDQLLPSVLLCEVFTAEELRGRKTGPDKIGSDMWKRIRQNKDERYHFFESVAVGADKLGAGLPELGVDFKRYFTIPTDELYLRMDRGHAQRRCRLVSPYLEHLTTRFAYFQCRVALPRNHESA